MDQLFAIIGNPPLSVKAVADALPLGPSASWGLSGYNGHRAVYFARRPVSLDRDRPVFQTAIERASESDTSILVGSIRQAGGSAGEISTTPPYHYRDWVFVHHGIVMNASTHLVLQESHPQGATDSERLMLWLLERVGTSLEPLKDLQQALQDLRPQISYTSLTFVLTHGECLWAYREFSETSLAAGETAESRDNKFGLVWSPVDGAIVLASEPLPLLSHLWKALPQRTLAEFRPGAAAPATVLV